jgi:hypothetical protein
VSPAKAEVYTTLWQNCLCPPQRQYPTEYLLAFAAGFKKSKFRPEGREGFLEKLQGFCQVLEEAIEIANKDLERLILARELMNRVADKCRSNSKLPDLVACSCRALW